MIWKKRSKYLFDASNSSGIEKEIIKQVNRLKPFDMELRKRNPKKPFVSEEENNCEEEINLTLQERISNINWCKCGCESKLITTFSESFFCRDTNKIPDKNFKST